MRRLIPTLVLLCAAAVACGGGSDVSAVANADEDVFVRLPSQILGLEVVTESISEGVQRSEQPFIDQVGLFGLRAGEEDLLRGTLQISRFTEKARPEESEFRGAILNRVGGTAPRRVHVGGTDVFITTGPNQTVFIWFQENGFFVLTAHTTYDFPRTLLRTILDQDIEL